MARHRERFERTDVPKPSALRNIISLGVIAASAIICMVMLSTFWHKANQMNALNDGYLDDALYDQLDTRSPTDGYERSDDTFSNVVVFIVDDIEAEPRTLQGAQLLVRNMTKGTATIVNLPLHTKMLAGESNVELSSYFNASGAAATIAPLTDAANVHVSHVIVATGTLWEQLERLQGPTLWALLSPSTNDLATMASDYRTSELVDLAEYLREVGFDNIVWMDAPYAEETFEDGTPVANIDKQQLCRDLGIFIDPNAVVEEETAEEDTSEEAPAEETSGEESGA